MSGHYRWIWPGTRAFSNVENRRNNVMRTQCSEQIVSPVESPKVGYIHCVMRRMMVLLREPSTTILPCHPRTSPSTSPSSSHVTRDWPPLYPLVQGLSSTEKGGSGEWRFRGRSAWEPNMPFDRPVAAQASAAREPEPIASKLRSWCRRPKEKCLCSIPV